MTGYCYYLSNI